LAREVDGLVPGKMVGWAVGRRGKGAVSSSLAALMAVLIIAVAAVTFLALTGYFTSIAARSGDIERMMMKSREVVKLAIGYDVVREDGQVRFPVRMQLKNAWSGTSEITYVMVLDKQGNVLYERSLDPPLVLYASETRFMRPSQLVPELAPYDGDWYRMRREIGLIILHTRLGNRFTSFYEAPGGPIIVYQGPAAANTETATTSPTTTTTTTTVTETYYSPTITTTVTETATEIVGAPATTTVTSTRTITSTVYSGTATRVETITVTATVTATSTEYRWTTVTKTETSTFTNTITVTRTYTYTSTHTYTTYTAILTTVWTTVYYEDYTKIWLYKAFGGQYPYWLAEAGSKPAGLRPLLMTVASQPTVTITVTTTITTPTTATVTTTITSTISTTAGTATKTETVTRTVTVTQPAAVRTVTVTYTSYDTVWKTTTKTITETKTDWTATYVTSTYTSWVTTTTKITVTTTQATTVTTTKTSFVCTRTVTNYDCKCGPIPIGVSNNCMWKCY
jgi:hypothetical protein